MGETGHFLLELDQLVSLPPFTLAVHADTLQRNSKVRQNADTMSHEVVLICRTMVLHTDDFIAIDRYH